MNPISNTKRAAERLLASVSTGIPTAFEGSDFTAVDGMYQRCQFLVSPPTDPVFTPGYHRENITMQVFILIPKGTGTAALYSQAEVIRNAFYKGLSMIEQGTTIRILRTAQVTGVVPLQENLLVTVLVPLTVDEFKN